LRAHANELRANERKIVLALLSRIDFILSISVFDYVVEAGDLARENLVPWVYLLSVS